MNLGSAEATHADGTPSLAEYDADAASMVVTWASQSAFARHWLPDGDLSPAAIMRRWHADPDVRPFLMCLDRQVLGYGELWVDEGEVELAHLIVARQSVAEAMARPSARC